MSLYYDAQTILDSSKKQGSLRTRVYNDKNLKCPPSQVYALLIEATKWSPILTEVIDKAQLLHAESKVCLFYRTLLDGFELTRPRVAQSSTRSVTGP